MKRIAGSAMWETPMSSAGRVWSDNDEGHNIIATVVEWVSVEPRTNWSWVGFLRGTRKKYLLRFSQSVLLGRTTLQFT